MNKKMSTARPELFPVPVKCAWYHLGLDFVEHAVLYVCEENSFLHLKENMDII